MKSRLSAGIEQLRARLSQFAREGRVAMTPILQKNEPPMFRPLFLTSVSQR